MSADRGRALGLAAPEVLGCLAMVACVGIEHAAGVYVPSESTGSGGNVCGLMVLVVTLGAISWRARHTPLVATWKRLFPALLALALTGAVAEAAYFEWVLGGLSEQMGAFTRITLASRGDPAAEIDEFATAVASSWSWRSTLPNTLALYLVWGGLLGAVVTSVTRPRTSG